MDIITTKSPGSENGTAKRGYMYAVIAGTAFTVAIAFVSLHDVRFGIESNFVKLSADPLIFFLAFGFLITCSVVTWVIAVLRKRFASGSLAGLITILCISIMLRDGPAFNDYMQWQIGFSVFIALVFNIASITGSGLAAVEKSIQWCCLLSCCASLSLLPTERFLQDSGVWRFRGIFDNPNVLGLYGLVGATRSIFASVINLPLTKLNWRKPAWVMCCAIVCSICIMLSGSRSVLLCLLFAGVLFSSTLVGNATYNNLPPPKFWMRKIWAPMLVILFGGIALTANRIGWLLNASDDSFNNRLDTMKAGWRLIMDAPTGVGFNNVLDVFMAHYNSPIMPQGAAVMRNDWFVTMAAYGICPGLITFIILFCGPIIVLVRTTIQPVYCNFSTYRLMSTQYAIIILCVFIFSTVNSAMFILPSSFLFWSLAGIYAASYDHATELVAYPKERPKGEAVSLYAS